MSVWTVRFEGSNTLVEVSSAQKVLDGVREGDWQSTDDVRGPNDTAWRPIEAHPQFEEYVSELEAPTKVEVDDAHLDMNPLIDVALVLLIFFILTTTYSSLRRTLEVAPEPTKDDGGAQTKPLTAQDVQDRTFKVEVFLVDDQPRVRVGDKIVDVADLESEFREITRTSGRNQMLFEFDDRIVWDIWAKVNDAAKAADVTQIYPKRKKSGP